MSRLIDIKHPFQIKDVKSINEYLFILKNILRIVSQKGAKEKPEGINIPIRWSSLFNDIVVDFGSNKQRDISGIHLDNLGLYFKESTEYFNSIAYLLSNLKNCSNSAALFEKYKLIKNENRFLNLIVDKEKIYFTGLYNRCQTSKRSGIYSSQRKKSILIDNSNELFKNIQKELNFIIQLQDYKLEKDYNAIYLSFLEKINTESVLLKEKNNLEKIYLFKNYIHKSLNREKISIKSYSDLLNKVEDIDNNKVFWFLIYHITLMFNHVLLNSLNSDNLNDIIIYDNISNEFIKIVKEYNIQLKVKEKQLSAPLLPVRF